MKPNPYQSPKSLESPRPPCSGFRIAAAVTILGLTAAILAMAFFVAYLQLFVWSDEEYHRQLMALVEHPLAPLAWPGLAATMIVVMTVADILRRRTFKSAWRLLAAVIFLNLLGAAYYWARELRRCRRKMR